VSTTDFFPPLVDDPSDFGAVAAANACSDVFAMGGRVVLALNVSAFPERMPEQAVAAILSAAAEVVVVATPFAGLDETVRANAPALAGKLVVSAVIPLRVADGEISVLDVAEGSAAQLVATRLPQSRVAAAFHNVSAVHLRDLERQLDEDIPVAADSEADRGIVVGLCADLGARGVGVGPLRLARYLEGFTAVLLTLNKLNRTQTGIRFTGLP